jgi:glycosyltransferase involved in cell wall biosynthesis
MAHPGSILVIVPTYGHFEYAKRAVESLVTHTPKDKLQIALVDDASPDWPTDWSDWPRFAGYRARYEHNGGLTRSWNYGLWLAREAGCEFAACGNSDLVFTQGWYEPLVRAVTEHGYDLIGPVTNAPGHHRPQDASRYAPVCPDDLDASLAATARRLRRYNRPTPCRFINGFFMFARTATWWENRFSESHCFNPKNRMTGNEDELQARWRARRQRIGFHPGSFVFHYRSVSRPRALENRASRGYMRMSK